MRMSKSSIIMLAFLFLLTSGSTWLTIHTSHELKHSKNNPKGISAYFNEVKYRQYDDNGKLNVIGYSPHMTLTNATKTLEGSKPQLTLFNSDNTIWHVSADHSTSNTETQITLLTGHVVLNRPKQADKPSSTVLTTHMTIYPKDKAVTDAPVTIIQGDGSTIKGRGCVANLKTNTIELLSHTRAIIQPSVNTEKKHAK